MLLRNYIKEYKTNRAFSVAEMLLVLLIISFLIMAMPPLIHKKYVKRVIRGQHGRYECWRDIDGHLYEYIATEKDGMLTGHSGGTKEAPEGKDVTSTGHCSFDAKDYASNASYFMFQIVGGGAGGSYPQYENDNTYYGDTATFAVGDVYLQDDIEKPGEDGSSHAGFVNEHIHNKTEWKWSYSRFIHEGLLNGDSKYYVANMEWVKDFFPPVYNINDIEFCTPQGSSGIPYPTYESEQKVTNTNIGQFAGPGYCVKIPRSTNTSKQLALPLYKDYYGTRDNSNGASFVIKIDSPVDYVIPVIEEFRLVDKTPNLNCDSPTCFHESQHTLWTDGCGKSEGPFPEDDPKCDSKTTTSLIEKYKRGEMTTPPWDANNYMGYADYTGEYWKVNSLYRKPYKSLIANAYVRLDDDAGTKDTADFPRVRFFNIEDDDNPQASNGYAHIKNKITLGDNNWMTNADVYTLADRHVYNDIAFNEFYSAYAPNPQKFAKYNGSFKIIRGKQGQANDGSVPWNEPITEYPVMPEITTSSNDYPTGNTYKDILNTTPAPEPETAASVSYTLPYPFTRSNSGYEYKGTNTYLQHKYIHYGRRVLPPLSYFWNSQLISNADQIPSLPTTNTTESWGTLSNGKNGGNALFPPKIRMKWEASYDTPTMAFAGNPGEAINMMLPKLENAMRFNIEYSTGKDGSAGDQLNRSGKNGGDTIVYEKNDTGAYNEIMRARGGRPISGTVKAAKVFLRGEKTCYASDDTEPTHVRTAVDGCLDAGFATKKTRFSTDSGFYIVDELDADSPTPSALSYYYNVTLPDPETGGHPELKASITPGTGGFGGYTYILGTASTERRSARGHNNFSLASLRATKQDAPDGTNYFDAYSATNPHGWKQDSNTTLGTYVYKTNADSITEQYHCTVQVGTGDDSKLGNVNSDKITFSPVHSDSSGTTHSVGICKPARGTPGAVVILW